MTRHYRVTLLILSLTVLIVIGYVITHSFKFLTEHFWFTSGLFLLILLSLIDQPNFSKDANVFINASTGWVSLMIISPSDRGQVWWTFFGFTTYLIISSLILIWIRKENLKQEPFTVIVISRINRELGKPETVFSTFFVWGAIRQFELNSYQFDLLLLFWIVFMILNLPGIASTITSLFKRENEFKNNVGNVLRLTEPKVVEALLPLNFPDNAIGNTAQILSHEKIEIGRGVFIDDRIIAGSRLGKIVITSKNDNWKAVSDISNGKCFVKLISEEQNKEKPISVVAKGTTINNLIFNLHPLIALQQGEIIYVQSQNNGKIFFQIIEAVIIEEPSSDGNIIQSIRVTASQLGLWSDSTKKFTVHPWIAPLGVLIYPAKNIEINIESLGNEYSKIGAVPNSNFPAHVYLEEVVTHNSAITGVTGSGKTYLSFHLIEALIGKKIKVVILDLTRQHYPHLEEYKPLKLKNADELKDWYENIDSSPIAIYEFENSSDFKVDTHKFVQKTFEVISSTELEAGKNLPAKLCIVFEEAHTLIPETQETIVNETARIILQGRKFGLGSVIITQRTANVKKTILSQCNTVIALQSFDQTALDFLKSYMGIEYSSLISRLPQYHGILVGKSSCSQKPLIFKINDFKDKWNKYEKVEESTKN